MALFLTRASGWSSKQILENIQGNKVIKTVVHYILFFLVGILCEFFMAEKLFLEISISIYS